MACSELRDGIAVAVIESADRIKFLNIVSVFVVAIIGFDAAVEDEDGGIDVLLLLP